MTIVRHNARMSAEVLAQCLNFGRYIFVVPFKVKREKSGHYTCEPHSLHYKTVALMVQISSVVFVFLNDWVGLLGSFTIRRIVFGIFNVFPIIGYLVFWTERCQFEDFFVALNTVSEAMEAAGIRTSYRDKCLRCMFKMATFLLLIYTTQKVLISYVCIYDGFYKGLQYYFMHARFVLQGKVNQTEFLLGFEGEGVSVAETVVATATAFGTCYTLVVFMYLSILCFALAQVLLCLSSSFTDHFKLLQHRSSSLQMMTRVANLMISLCSKMDDAIGHLIMTFCLALIPYYALSMQAILDVNFYNTQMACIIESAGFVVILITAAEANTKMKRAGNEIATHAAVVSSSKTVALNLLLVTSNSQDMISSLLLHQRLNCNEFGLHGKVLTITYTLVGSVAGLVLSYSVIFYQFKSFN